VGFGEILLIMVIALVVLGPERLPKLANDIGRFIGRARAMARQLSMQLEQEVHLEDLVREQKRAADAAPQPNAAPAPAAHDNPPAAGPDAPLAGAPSDEVHQHGEPVIAPTPANPTATATTAPDVHP
jgi:sec-independent protein translocase protein TatB